MDELLIRYLKSRKKVQIDLAELQSIYSGEMDYPTFALLIKQCEDKGILKPVKKHLTNNREIPLYHTYRIDKGYFKEDCLNQIQSMRLKIHESMDLQAYYALDEKTWNHDLPYIKKIDTYIKEKGFPIGEVSAPEMAYQLMGDEKWIDEKGGKLLLQRVKLWDKFNISYKVDPLMLAVNPKALQGTRYRHLVVENKATFYDCLEGLHKTSFTSLIYGMGWKIIANIGMLNQQLGIEGLSTLYYFGDIDYEGIAIWHRLNESMKVVPAIPLYEALLETEKALGKENQRRRPEVISDFTEGSTEAEGSKIKKHLEGGYYYPQEALNKEVLIKIWRQM